MAATASEEATAARLTVAVDSGGRRAKAATKLSRYRASGITQSSGTAATSVVRNVVAPSMRAEGSAAIAIQRSRTGQRSAAAEVTARTRAWPATASTRRAQSPARRTNAAYPTVQSRACSCSVSLGSISVG